MPGSLPFAVAGAEPAFDTPVHVGRPNQPVRARFFELLDEALDRNWLSNNGPLVRRFEEKVAEVVGTDHVVAVASGTAGLQVCMRALDVTGPVVMPAFTFVASAAAARWLDIDPLLADIEPRRYGLDPIAADRIDQIGAILGVHVWGVACDVDGLTRLGAQRGVPVIFDAAHGLGATEQGRAVGGFGEAEVFSFHATKLVHTAEGGAISTNDPALAEELRRAINFGFVGYDQVDGLGTNAKLSELHAAMGLAMLEQLPMILETNVANRSVYDETLNEIPGIELTVPPPGATSNDQYVVVLVDPERFGLDRDDLYSLLHAEQVLARRYFHPGVHRMPAYAAFAADETLPETDRLSERCLSLPTGTGTTPEMIRRIADVVATAHRRASDLAPILADRPLP